jgi:hypothetical protein
MAMAMKNQITVKITPDAICGWKVVILTDGGEVSWHSNGPRHTAQAIAKEVEKILTREKIYD